MRFLLWNFFFFHLKISIKNKVISININCSNCWPLSCSPYLKILKSPLFFGGKWQRVLRYIILKCYFNINKIFYFNLYWNYNSFKYEDCLVTRMLVAPSQIHHLWSDVEQQGSDLETSLHIWICYNREKTVCWKHFI